MRRAWLVAWAVLVLVSGAKAAQPVQWALGTASTGSGPYVWGATIATVVNQQQDRIRLSAQSTAGYQENLILVAAGEVAVGMATGEDLGAAVAGAGRYAGHPELRRLRRLFVFTITPFHYVVRADSNIFNFDDLRGKRFNVGPPAQATRYINENLIKALGTRLEDYRIFELPTGATFGALRDRIIDATGNGYAVGHGPLQELSATTPVRLLSIPDDVFERLNALYDGILIRTTIPAGSYRGQTEAARTFALSSVLFVRDDQDPELVYQLTRAFWQALPKLQQDPAFQSLSLEIALGGSRAPLHPGAERYFRELGLLP